MQPNRRSSSRDLVSHDAFNEVPTGRSVIVVPITTSASQAKRGPTVVELPGRATGLPRTSFVVFHQVTTLDRAKLTRRLGGLSSEMLREVEEGLKAAVDLD
jgi:mRNA interferase MazF